MGQTTFAKLRDLAYPRPVTDLSCDAIVKVLPASYNWDCFKLQVFFKCLQEDGEWVAEFVANLKCLAKTCNFGKYLDTTFWDQLVCRLCDHKCQWDLLCISDLTLAVAIQKTTAAETAEKGSKHIHADMAGDKPLSQDLHKMSVPSHKLCYCCGKSHTSQVRTTVGLGLQHATHARN